MKKISIIYASTTGNTEVVAETIEKNLEGEVTLSDVRNATDDMVKNADIVLYGSSTWGCGELQEDFTPYYNAMNSNLLSGKDVAVFGCGDEDNFEDVFCEATELIKNKVTECGANIVCENLKVNGDPSDNMDKIIAFAKGLHVKDNRR